ncbi:uncharacterized protein DSM5745_05514 [Aspergillus mulundensis]|uniref:Uncharacterized protein n=1 Tax=Aspergillus mulundensis TaxID=1810919 RepID=A0A3D8RX68_9EURO|nr:Uncharacterized protein DSM5745_05514 [Aspergillus mulundensis]RDW78662.1 Uncharacterized protein DSM5745_05514 [Aspergillus mulundensis]
MSRERLLVRPKSRLEKLPAEIIQEIFLRCLEINLPRASIYLARALSDPTIYTWLVRLAFAKADGEGSTFLTEHFLPPCGVVGHIEPDELKELRTRILECRWCTLPLIRSCQLAFLNHVIEYKRPEISIIPDDRPLLAGFAGWFDNLESCNKALNGQRGENDLALRANRPGHELDGSDSESSHDYNVAIWFRLGIIEIHAVGNNQPCGKSYFELPCCESSSIPDKLLCPPWTDQKLEFLQLISTRAFLDKDTEFRRATRTLRRLIRDRDFATFARLLDLRVRIECYGFPVIWPTSNVVFRAALKYADEHGDPFVRLLVEERWEHIDPEDILLKEKLLKSLLDSSHT